MLRASRLLCQLHRRRHHAEGDIMSNLGTVGNFGVVTKTGRSISVKWAPR